MSSSQRPSASSAMPPRSSSSGRSSSYSTATPPTLRSSRSPSPNTKRSSGLKPWHNAQELEMLPSRQIQNQTGGIARANRSAVNVDYNMSTQGAASAYSTASSTTASRSRRHSSTSSNDDEYDTYGYSDSHHSSAKNNNNDGTTATNTAQTKPTKEDAYTRYLQQKEKSTATATPPIAYNRSSSFTNGSSADGTTSSSITATPSPSTARRISSSGPAIPNTRPASTGRPPIRSQSPSALDYEDDLPKSSAGDDARSLRAKRLAQQKPTSSGITNGNDLRFQSHNPAVQAYLARKDKEKEQKQQRSSSTNAAAPNYYETLMQKHEALLQKSRSTSTSPASMIEKEEKYDEPNNPTSATRRPSFNNTQQPQQHGMGRPPAQPKAVQVQANTTTYTYQFQPSTNTTTAAAATTNSSSDTSVTRARRLLQSSSTTTISTNGSVPSHHHQDNPTKMAAATPPPRRSSSPASTTPNNSHVKSSPLLHARSNSAGSHSHNNPTTTTAQAQHYNNRANRRHTTMDVSDPTHKIGTSSTRRTSSSSSVATPPQIQRRTSSGSHSYSSNNSNKKPVSPSRLTDYSKNKADINNDATTDSSVTRARRLLLEGKERNNHSTTSLPLPPIHSLASENDNNNASAGSFRQDNTQQQNNADDNADVHKIPPSGEKGMNGSLSKISSHPRPAIQETIPSHLVNDDWSVRLCVISAVDFPVHVVPNMPLSPVLKVGLVYIPFAETAYGKERLLRDIDRKGLGAVSEQMRCTTTKLLSKRDNGAVEFHEELRWDHVALKPGENDTLALAVELCARGVLRPANLHESPPAQSASNIDSKGGSWFGNPLRGSVPPSPVARGSSADAPSDVSSSTTSSTPVGPLGRVGNMLRRSRGLQASALESAQASAAAAVAKLLVEGSTSPATPGRDVISTAPAGVTAPPAPVSIGQSGRASSSTSATPAAQEWDVTLRKSPESPNKSSSKVIMTDDIRLGSLLIPLTEIEDLQRVIQDRGEPARLEKWFEIQNMNAAIVNANSNANAPSSSTGRFFSRGGGDGGAATSAGSRSQTPGATGGGAGSNRARRNPSILLELSLYPPDVLDDSEDEMDENDDEGDFDSSTSSHVPRQLAVTRSFAKRTTMQVRHQLKLQSKNTESNAANSQSPKRDSIRDAKKALAVSQDPVLEPGIIDFISVVGARDIGDQKLDDGSKGWVQSTPECCVLEQFPPSDDFHYSQQNSNRHAVLPQKVEWFCFPDGVKLWRGTQPPAASDFLSQQQQQEASPIMTPSQIMVSEAESTSLALFDAYLNCTTSFNWFVIASNSEEYGSSSVKTYGAVIRFYVPAPRGIDPTQDDFAQTLMGGSSSRFEEDETDLWSEQQQQEGPQSRGLFGAKGATPPSKKEKRRLWVPIGICVTSSLPIVGVMEAVLMRCCEMLASRPKIMPMKENKIHNMIQRHLANLIMNFPQPTAGAVNCSVPFLLGQPLEVRLPPKAGLPPLPHGNAIASVCRLLGPEGFIFVLAALLTESKIVLHSHNTANCAMVAEVMTALIYPFIWSLPYIPVLPVGMLEIIEAPLSYILGIPSSCLEQNMVDPMVLEDVVVVDLDAGFSSPDWKTTTTKYKSPTPLPSLVASNISRAVYRLLRALENEQEFGEKHVHPVSNASDRLPRVQPESKAEREFRIAIALEMGGLVRGYQDCLVFVSTSQPVFNREKFLKRAPALFIEEPTGGTSAIGSRANKVKTNRRILSSRSKRFLSILVNCQHFHQFLEMLRSEECAFFHAVMEMWIVGGENHLSSDAGSVFESGSSFDHTKAIAYLSKSLQSLEDTISTYKVPQPYFDNPNGSSPADDELQDEDYQVLSRESRFPRNLLQQIDVGDDQDMNASMARDEGGVHASLSVQYLVELEKNPWRYKDVLDVSVPEITDESKGITQVIAGNQIVPMVDKVKLRDALGDRKYRAWKQSRDQVGDDVDFSGSNSMEDKLTPGDFGTSLDLASLMTSATEDTFSETSSQSSLANVSTGPSGNSGSKLTSEQQRVANAKDRDVLRRCLEKAYAAKPSQQEGTQDLSDVFTHHGRDLVAEAEVALRNPSAQNFLLSLLSKRSKLDEKHKQRQSQGRRPSERRPSNTSSRLEPIAFECVVRLCCAMLDSCMETKDYEPAYLLLCQTAGLFTLQSDNGGEDGMDNDGSADDAASIFHPIYMTARLGLHPLFADLGLWQKVMTLHLAEKQANLAASEHRNESTSTRSSSPSLSRSDSFENDGPSSNTDKVYEAAVATLYEMLGYGIPAEELARFATKVSQTYGWFGPGSEKGQSLLLLARRLSMRRELAESGGVAPGETGDLDIMRARTNTEDSSRDMTTETSRVSGSHVNDDDDAEYEMLEIGWCHPAAPSAAEGKVSGTNSGSSYRGGGQQTEYMTRSAVTALATFGPSVVVSGGLDGGVFLAHTAARDEDDDTDVSTVTHPSVMIRGIHLDWGSSGSRAIPGSTVSSSADGEYGVGAVSCLAAATGAGGHHNRTTATSQTTKDVLGLMDDEDMIKEMEDSRVIAGTTCGDLRIWSVKDVYAAMHSATTGEEPDGGSEPVQQRRGGRRTNRTGQATSSFVSASPARRRAANRSFSTDGNGKGGNTPFNRLKFSLRGRALSGHRGGVTCVDVPSNVYRPDSVVTGGADGLIKLWSLRTSTVGRGSFITTAASSTTSQLGRRLTTNRGGDAQSVFSGHGGRVLCVKTAWHGDRLLSGGADRTIRIWDMMSAGKGKGAGANNGDAACLHTLSGHFGWVTHVQYWGPNTIVSGSTDRSIALWDARVRNSPLFVLRHHRAPISDLLVGSRTDPLMVSAASDGSVTTWDFRSLSGAAQSDSRDVSADASSSDPPPGGIRHCKVVRHPAAIMSLGPGQDRFSLAKAGPVLLSRGDRQSARTVISAGSDAVMREWDMATGGVVKEWSSGHCDALSSLTSLAAASSNLLLGVAADGEGSASVGGTITSSWDGTIRMQKRIRKQKRKPVQSVLSC